MWVLLLSPFAIACPRNSRSDRLNDRVELRDSFMPLPTGARLGPYEILAAIGAGGMGEVYKARDTRLDRVVAVKICAEQFSERFEREARAVAALNHPNICTLHDVGPNYRICFPPRIGANTASTARALGGRIAGRDRWPNSNLAGVGDRLSSYMRLSSRGLMNE